jgi:methylamine--corrinoid protein Co-methyltransferase
MLSGSAAAKGVAQDKTTGMEARIMGEAAAATAGMKVSEVNKIIEKLVSSYEKNYANAPGGKTFRECYDVLSVKPTAEYMKVYDGAVKKLRDLGIMIRE